MRNRAGDLGGVLLGIMSAVGLFLWCVLVIFWRVIRKGWRFAWDLRCYEWILLMVAFWWSLVIFLLVWI
jgi:hypothetical protein